MRKLMLALAAVSLLGLAACAEHNGPMERAGRNIDKAANKTAKAVGTALEKTGQAIEKGGEKIHEKVEEKSAGK